MSEPLGTAEYLETFADLAGQCGAGTLTADDIARARTRDDLGITSLQMILVMATYCGMRGDVEFRPEWVERIEEIDGVVEVMREIDALALAPAGAP